MRRTLAAWCAFTLGLFTAGCFEAPNLNGLECDSDRSCPTGFACGLDSVCRPLDAVTDGGAPPDAGTSTVASGDCRAGQSRACYPGSAATRNVGLCVDGTETCQSGTWGPCEGARLPALTEACDRRDDDCDGAIDEGCACLEGATQPCYAGPQGTEGIAGCRAGQQTCSGGTWGACEGQVLPAIETCNQADDDCDGTVDNGTNACGGACALDVVPASACDAESADDLDACADDTYVCQGLNAVACENRGEDVDQDNYSAGLVQCGGDCRDDDENVRPGVLELCNGFDDDCDGTTDEDCACTTGEVRACYAGPPGTEGVAACRAGQQECVGGAWGACEGQVLPESEVCNDLDDDCDGTPDDGSNGCGGVCPLSGAPGALCDALTPDDLDQCPDDLFVCDGPNAVTCTNAGQDGDRDDYSVGLVSCGGDCADNNASVNPSVPEVCNGIDDNCNGTTDEDCDCIEGESRACYGGPPGTEGVAQCRAGTQTCVAGRWSACTGEILPSPEVCNDADDDCDGVADDGDNACGGACPLGNPVGAACDADTANDLDSCPDDRFACAGINATACVNAGQDQDSDSYSAGARTCGGDCQDTNANVNPGATEACNAFDDNCDGTVDEGCNYDPTACDVMPPDAADTTEPAPLPPCAAAQYHVAVDGNDSNSGLTPAEAFATINRALEAAQPGDCVRLQGGEYLQDVVTVRSGTPSAPIRVTGPRSVIVRGATDYVVFRVRHDYLYFDGFSIDGLAGDPTIPEGYRTRLMSIHSETANVGVRGVVVRNISFQNAAGGCLRMHYFVTDSEVAFNAFRDCDMWYRLTGTLDTEGDGVHIGTYFGGLQNNPTVDPDRSARNWVHNNIFERLSQCVDIMDDSVGNVIENNTCSGGHILESGGIEVRGEWNVVRDNDIHTGGGSGIRIPWHPPAPPSCNDFVRNRLTGNDRTAFWFDGAPQGLVCDNESLQNAQGVSGGEFADLFDPTAPCP